MMTVTTKTVGQKTYVQYPKLMRSKETGYIYLFESETKSTVIVGSQVGMHCNFSENISMGERFEDYMGEVILKNLEDHD